MSSGSASTHEVVASTRGILLTKISAAHQTDCWKTTGSQLTEYGPVFGHLSIVIGLRDHSYVIRADGPGSSSTEVPLENVKEYVIKTRIWHEITSTVGRQMALYLSVAESQSKFTAVLTSALKILGKFNRLRAPADLISVDELSSQAQRIVLLCSLPIADVRQPPAQQRQEETYTKLRSSTRLPQHKDTRCPCRRRCCSSYEQHYDTDSPSRAAAAAATIEALTVGSHADDSDDSDEVYSEPYETFRRRGGPTETLAKIPPDTSPGSPGNEPPSFAQTPCRRRPQSPDGCRPKSQISTVPSVTRDWRSAGLAGSWRCGRCSFDNEAPLFCCDMCESVRPDVWQCPNDVKCKRRLNPVEQNSCPECKAWKCQACTSINAWSSTSCTVCDHFHR